MQAVIYLAVLELRARWRGWALLVLLVAAAGGPVLAAAAGASRTQSAYPRFLTASKASDVLAAPYFSGQPGYFGALTRLAGVREVAPFVILNLQPLGHGSWAARVTSTVAPVDGRQRLDVPRVLAGRLPAADRAGEIAVDHRTAAMLGLRVGSVLTMRAVPNDPPPGTAEPGQRPARPRLLRERVAGIVVTRGTVLPVNELDKVPVILASRALFHRLGERYLGAAGAYVKLRPGASPEAFGRRAQSLARRFPATGGGAFVTDQGAQAAAVQRAIRPEAVALALFALVLAVTALLIVGQAATRLLATGSPDTPALAALGLTRRQLMAAGLIKVGVAAAIGAAVAAGVAVAASPLMPIGAARLAEPDPGVSADALVLAAGAAAIVVLLVAWAAWPAWRLTSTGTRTDGTPAAPGRWPRLTAALAGAGAPVTAAAGVRLALEPGRGRTAVPVRAALAGTALSVLAVTAAITFGANLLHLVNTPPLYGKRWDAAIDVQFPAPAITATATEQLGHLPGITGWTFGHHGAVGIAGHVIPAIGLIAGKGPLLSPTLLQGRPPRTGSEIVLGTSTLRQIGRHVGQTVTVTVNGHPLRQRIVGRAVFPNFGQGRFTPTDLGQGAQTTAAVLQNEQAPPGFEFVLLSFAPGPRRAANIAGFQRSMTGFCQTVQQSTCVVTAQRPNGITNYASIDRTPAVLAALLAVIGVAVLAQFIAVSARQRRRDFAILKTLGMFRRQISAITAWQVSTLTGLALLAGLPLGIAAGRWSWALFAHGLGIPAAAITPLWPVLLMVPAVILIANAVALWPGRATARLSPADVLRAE
jgi:putative ABC transport system permease protein